MEVGGRGRSFDRLPGRGASSQQVRPAPSTNSSTRGIQERICSGEEFLVPGYGKINFAEASLTFPAQQNGHSLREATQWRHLGWQVPSANEECRLSGCLRRKRGRHRIVLNRIHQANLQCSRRVQFLRRQKHLQCSRFAHQSRQTLRTSPSGDEAQGRAAMPEQCVRPRDAAIARQCEVESSPHAISVHGSDGWRRKVGDSVHQPLSHLRKAECVRPVELCDLAQLGSGGKEVCVAGDHQARRRICREFFQRGGQRQDAIAR
jgi:hypothetical protein